MGPSQGLLLNFFVKFQVYRVMSSHVPFILPQLSVITLHRCGTSLSLSPSYAGDGTQGFIHAKLH